MGLGCGGGIGEKRWAVGVAGGAQGRGEGRVRRRAPRVRQGLRIAGLRICAAAVSWVCRQGRVPQCSGPRHSAPRRECLSLSQAGTRRGVARPRPRTCAKACAAAAYAGRAPCLLPQKTHNRLISIPAADSWRSRSRCRPAITWAVRSSNSMCQINTDSDSQFYSFTKSQ